MRRALAFLTPLGGAATPDGRTMRWFPLVGAAIGALVGVVWWGSAKGWTSPLVPAALAVLADLVLTGMLHIDGLADTADGLLAHLSRARRLEVMTTPDVGAFGLAAVAVALVCRFAAFASIRPDVAVVAGIWCASRSVMVLGPALLPYARAQGGLASVFLDGPRSGLIATGSIGVAAGAGLSAVGAGWAGVIAVVALVVGAALVFALARAQIGGFTGDVLGAAGVLGETVALFVVTARW